MDSLGPHLDYVKKKAERVNNSPRYKPDHFSPRLLPEDGQYLFSYHKTLTSYYFTSKVIIKRQRTQDEIWTDIYGEPIIVPYLADRLLNEAAVLRFLAEHTTIPVPRVLGLWIVNNVVRLKTSLAPANGIQLSQVDKSHLPVAIATVTEELESQIFPQIRRFRRNYLGSVNPTLPVVPPPRLRSPKDNRVWTRMDRDSDEYV